MLVKIFFRFGPVHVPLRRRWKDGEPFEVSLGHDKFVIQALRPHTENTHIDEDSAARDKVADAYIPILVTAEQPRTPKDYQEIVDGITTSIGSVVEAIRISTRQPHLRLHSIADGLAFDSAQTLDGNDLTELNVALRNWMEEQRDRPLPRLSASDWQQFLKAPSEDGAPSGEHSWDWHFPVHESLLLDADLAVQSDIRVTVLYSALSCEVFVQDWLEQRAKKDPKLQKWLTWARPKDQNEKGVSATAYYDLGLYLATGRSLKEERALWEALGKLVGARNDIAHGRRVPDGYEPQDAIGTTRRVIDWVQNLTVTG